MHRRTRISVGQATAALVLLQMTAHAAADALPDHDNGPLTGNFGLPDSTEGGEITGRSLYNWHTSFIVASHNIDDTIDAERLYADGETSRVAISFGYGLAKNIDVGVEVPYLWHQSGNLDSLIDDWHDVFGFPGGSRKARARDQLEFLYADSQLPTVALDNNAHGIGDVRLLAGLQLSRTENHSLALRLGIKLPTGDADDLLGSGGTDFSIGLAGDATGLWSNEKLDGFYRANVTYLGAPDLLENRYKDLVGQLSFGLGYGVHQSVRLKLQSKIRSAVYDSEIESLGKTSFSLTFGASFRVTDRHHLTISVGEDLVPGTVPDVSFQIAFGYAGG